MLLIKKIKMILKKNEKNALFHQFYIYREQNISVEFYFMEGCYSKIKKNSEPVVYSLAAHH